MEFCPWQIFRTPLVDACGSALPAANLCQSLTVRQKEILHSVGFSLVLVSQPTSDESERPNQSRNPPEMARATRAGSFQLHPSCGSLLTHRSQSPVPHCSWLWSSFLRPRLKKNPQSARKKQPTRPSCSIGTTCPPSPRHLAPKGS